MFNLVNDPWISVKLLNKKRDTLSLLDVFTQSKNISEIIDVPDVKFSIFRLINAIAIHANRNHQELFGNANDIFIDNVVTYLTANTKLFNLRSEHDFAFMQVNSEFKFKYNSKPLACLSNLWASGNNAIVMTQQCQYDYSDIATTKLLIVAQCAKFLIKIDKPSDSQFKPATSISQNGAGGTLHLIPVGANLFETICLNLISEDELKLIGFDGYGLPSWEMHTNDFSEFQSGFLGNLFQKSKAIKLDGDNVWLGYGFKYPSWNTTGILQHDVPCNGQKKKDDGLVNDYVITKGNITLWRDFNAYVNSTSPSLTINPKMSFCKRYANFPNAKIWLFGAESIMQGAGVTKAVWWIDELFSSVELLGLSIYQYLTQDIAYETILKKINSASEIPKRILKEIEFAFKLSVAEHELLGCKLVKNKFKGRTEIVNCVNAITEMYWMDLTNKFEQVCNDNWFNDTESIDVFVNKWKHICIDSYINAIQQTFPYSTFKTEMVIVNMLTKTHQKLNRIKLY